MKTVTKSSIEQQKSWSKVKHMEALVSFDRGTRRVEESVVKALDPLVDVNIFKKITKQIMRAKVCDTKKAVEKATLVKKLSIL